MFNHGTLEEAFGDVNDIHRFSHIITPIRKGCNKTVEGKMFLTVKEANLMILWYLWGLKVRMTYTGSQYFLAPENTGMHHVPFYHLVLLDNLQKKLYNPRSLERGKI